MSVEARTRIAEAQGATIDDEATGALAVETTTVSSAESTTGNTLFPLLIQPPIPLYPVDNNRLPAILRNQDQGMLSLIEDRHINGNPCMA